MSTPTHSDESVFEVARQIQSDQAREAYLQQAFHNDPARMDRMRSLLTHYRENESFLEAPYDAVAVTTATSSKVEMEGEEIGPYRLLQKIGEGGFGVVYMAQQSSPIRRKVALKIVKLGMDTEEVVARFEAERQALAIMDHPNVARVFDAGTTKTGRPFFVMELVNGVTITDYADKNNLSTRERMKLFASVCRAVHHAHQKGVIHRDIKPSNVMVTLHDGNPVPKVIDFGVAKAVSQPLTEKTMFTRYGQVMGTPQYMSPEQAEMSGLDVDTRSDVYSLGVLLYELITGRTPFLSEEFQRAGFDEMRRMIREDEPLRPSNVLQTLDARSATVVASHRSCKPDALCRAIRGELDWIVMKALEKDRNRRYDSAVRLAEDVDHYLDDQPVEATPPTIGYKLGKSYRRNRVACWTAGGIGASLLIALIVSTTALRQSQHKTALLTQAQEQLQRQRLVAESEAENADQQARSSQRTLNLLLNVLAMAEINPQTGKEYTVTEALAAIGSESDSLSKAKLPRQAAARLHRLVGQKYMDYEKRDLATWHFESALEACKVAYGERSLEAAWCLYALGLLNGSHEQLIESLSICRELGPDGDQLVKSLVGLGKVALDRDDHEAAESYLVQACENYSAMDRSLALEEIPFIWMMRLSREMDRDRDADKYEKLAIDAAKQTYKRSHKRWMSLARRLRDENKYKEAEYLLLVADSIELTPGDDDAAYYLGIDYHSVGDLGRSERFLRRSILQSREQGKTYRTAGSHRFLARTLESLGKLEESAEHACLAIEYAIGQSNIEHVLQACGILSRLPHELRQAYSARFEELREALLEHQSRDPDSVVSTGYLVLLYIADGDLENAERLAMEILEVENPRSQVSPAIFKRLANELSKVGQFDRSARWIREAMNRRDVELDPRSIVWDLAGIARNDYRVGRLQSASEKIEQALAMGTESQPLNDFTKLWLSRERGLLCEQLGQHQVAKKLYKIAFDGLNRANAEDRVVWTEGLDNALRRELAIELNVIDTAELERIEREVIDDANRNALTPNAHIDTAMTWVSVGMIREKRGENAAAGDAYSKALFAELAISSEPIEWIGRRVVTLLGKTGDWEKGAEIFKRVIEHRDGFLQGPVPERAYPRIRLAEILVQMKSDPERAAKLLDEAEEIYRHHERTPDSVYEEIEQLRNQVVAL